MNNNEKSRGRQLERYFKGAANHRRIDIMLLIHKCPESNVDDIAQSLKANFNTVSVHLQRLVQAGLVNKTHKGRTVTHVLSPYGNSFVQFMQKF